MKKKIIVGYIGLGRRGKSVLKSCLSKMNDVEIRTICDLSEERMAAANDLLVNAGKKPAQTTRDYHDILNDPKIDAVFIMTGWDNRPGLAAESLRAGKHTAIEVGCAATLEECFALVDAHEETGVPLMMLENCCYGHRELMLLNMIKQGLFGELVHCTGGYMHYLPHEELFKNIDREDPPHYRLPHYINSNRENYPTHELGPISKFLSINRGNRMVRLVSVASKSCGLKQFAKDHLGEDSKYAAMDYAQGDIIDTVITCANGETIHLTLDTTVPRAYYSRNISVRGTKGMSDENTRVVFLEGMTEGVRDNEKEFHEKYDHPLQREFREQGPQGGHGGMDWLVCRAFIESVKKGTNTPIDAYDTALWLSVGCLSEQSIRQGGSAVEIPDFTKGKWKCREPYTKGKYCLEEVCEEPDVAIFQ